VLFFRLSGRLSVKNWPLPAICGNGKVQTKRSQSFAWSLEWHKSVSAESSGEQKSVGAGTNWSITRSIRSSKPKTSAIDPLPAMFAALRKNSRLTLKLSPGDYVPICKKAGHCSQGMHAAMTVLR
jgi:hypothetical protein